MTSAATDIRTPNFIADIAAGRVELPTIPQVVQRLIAAFRHPAVDTRKISEELSRDPVLTAKVLRIANSSFFGGQRSMASIDAAVTMVGNQAINNLIVACGVSSTFARVPGIDLPVFWRDALVVATAAGKLAARVGADADAAYISGLLHETGHLILCQTYPAVADGMFTGFATVRGAKLMAIENEAFGIAHPTVGAMWAESLGFPERVVETIRRSGSTPSDADTVLDLVLRGASRLGFSVSRKVAADVAVATLPTRVRSEFANAAGAPNEAFGALYEAISQVASTL